MSPKPLDGCKVAILGSGVAGLCAAVALVERGADVTVHERSLSLGQGSCSWMAGGMLAPYCERVAADSWVCERGRFALEWWPRHVQDTVRLGTLVLAHRHHPWELKAFASRSDGHLRVDAHAIAALEPSIDSRFTEGLWYSDEGHVDPRRALPALACGLRQRHVRFQFGSAILPENAKADVVIDCRGLAARDALPTLQGVRGEMVLFRTRHLKFSRTLRLLHPDHPIYIVPRGDGVFMLGATSIETDDKSPMSVRSALELLTTACALHPALAHAEIIELGVGIRPAFPDRMPQLIQRNRTIYFNGLYRHGFLLGPWYAEQLATQLAHARAVAA